jgi:hypothetical protein
MIRDRLVPVVLAAMWLFSMCLGQLWLLRYQFVTGSDTVAPAAWPARSSLRPGSGKFTLLMFAHPRCPCTRASLEQLSRVIARSGGKADVYVVFVRPPGARTGWERSDLWSRALEIPGVQTLVDEEGKEAHRFGAETSGLTLLYSPNGTLVFRGGITEGRGHEGDNLGSSLILARLTGAGEDLGETATFGCPLFGQFSECKAGGSECTP